MADAGLFIGFGNPVRGRERQALAVFNEALEYYGRLQQQGEIESFEPAFLEPHGGDLGGFILAKGAAAQVAQIQASEEFQRLANRALPVVGSLGIVPAVVDAGVQRVFADWSSHLDELT